MRFVNRAAAGRELAAECLRALGATGVDAGAPTGSDAARPAVVLGIPRGGVIVAAEVARSLGAPLDVAIARKLRAPAQPELAIGAVTPDGQADVDHDLVRTLRVTPQYLDAEIDAARAEIGRRLRTYRSGAQPAPVAGRRVIVVDDGIATGYTMMATLRWLRRQSPAELVLAVPVAAPDSLEGLRVQADRVICLHPPADFRAVGQFYLDFREVGDAAVIEALNRGAP